MVGRHAVESLSSYELRLVTLGLLLLGYLMINVVAGALSAAVFPLDVAQYEPTVTGINLTK